MKPRSTPTPSGRPTHLGAPAGRRTAAPDGTPREGARLSVLRRRPLIVTTAVTIVLAVTATTVNLAVEHTARGRIAEAVACRLKPTGSVSADFTGAFAGLRAITGNLGTAHIAAEGVRRGGTEVNVAADLHDVSTDGTISGGTATATITYAELQKRLAAQGGGAQGLTVGSDSGGLVLTGRLGRLGLPVTVHTRVTTARDSLTVTPTSVSVLGQDIAVARLSSMPGGDGVADRLTPHTVALPQLPSGVRLTGARTDGRGLALALDVTRAAAVQHKGAACA